jgi:thiamine pyrophosphate-dependent acetolactate synthase large subunit-like protein
MDAWTGGRAVVELLKVEGVKHVFGIVGSTFLDVLDRLYDDSSVEYINVRHEQAAAFMADGLARVTDGPGVCLVTSGPGATNLMTGVAAAYVAHSPVVVLVGGIALDHYQKDAFQEYDLLSMFRPVTKHAVLINKAERIPELLRGALRTAMSGRPGPVFVEIPRDVLGGKLPPVSALAPERYRVTHPQAPHAAAVSAAVERLRRAERPLLLVGGGATRAGANQVVVELSERCGIPMITAYGRNDAVPSAHPLYLGPLGRAGAPEAAAACRRADLIVAVGSRLAQFTSQFDDRYVRPDTAIIQIDIEGRDIGRYYPVAVGIQADARETVQALLGALDRDGAPEERAAWRREAETLRSQRLARLAAEANLGTEPMKPQRV